DRRSAQLAPRDRQDRRRTGVGAIPVHRHAAIRARQGRSWRFSACLRPVISRVRPLMRIRRPVLSNSPRDVFSSHTSWLSGRMKTKGDRIRGTIDAETALVRLQTRAVVRMNPPEELAGGDSLI